MKVRSPAFRQSLVVTVVAGTTVAGACSDAEDRDASRTAPSDTNPSDTNDSNPDGAGTRPAATDGPAPLGTETPTSSGGSGGNAPGVAGSGAGGRSSPGVVDSGGAGGTDPGCPGSLTAALANPELRECQERGKACDVPVDCRSGQQTLTVTCEDAQWQGPTGCDEPYDFCPDATGGLGPHTTAVYCVDGEWTTEVGSVDFGFGLIACPIEPPADGGPCDVLGGTESGGDRDHCGYPCDDSAIWTVFSCVASDDGLRGTWISDGACD